MNIIFNLHTCDDKCVCHIHDLPLYYSPRERLHACQNPDCEYAHGYETAIAKKMEEWYIEDAKRWRNIMYGE